MLAASYWSLLDPAIEMAKDSKSYGEEGEYAFIPVAIGFFWGAAFVYGSDLLMSRLGVQSPVQLGMMLVKLSSLCVNESFVSNHEFCVSVLQRNEDDSDYTASSREGTPVDPGKSNSNILYAPHDAALRKRRHRTTSCESAEEGITDLELSKNTKRDKADAHWKRILLLIIAITVHNIPEGLAVGVGFGAVGRSASATFESAR